MDKVKLDKLKAYADKSRSKVFALSNWIKLNVKSFRLIDALECIYDYAKGSPQKMDDIIEHLTAKRKVYGRTQVYAGNTTPKMDIVKGNDGNLLLTGYENAEPLPLKGQKLPRNPNIFRKSDSQVKKTYQNIEDRIYDIGKEVRNMWPNASKTYISLAIVAIRKYAQIKKINTNRVIDGLKNGRLIFDDDTFEIKTTNNESRTVILDEDTIKRIVEEYQMTEYKFYSYIKKFLHDLLVDPVNAKPSDVLSSNGLTRYRLIHYLVNYGIVEKDEKLVDSDENGEPKNVTMKVRYKVPKKNFDRKLKRLYIRLFEKNIPTHEHVVSEDGECGGATGSDASGQYSQPLFGIQRREIYNVEEATTTDTVGSYQYTAPFVGDKETLSRKNGVGGSVSINKM
jgi:hypothetical protein